MKMGNLPVLKPREVAAILEKLGFVEVRQRGSHKQYRHADGRGTTVPLHSGRDLSPVLPQADRQRHRPRGRRDAATQVELCSATPDEGYCLSFVAAPLLRFDYFFASTCRSG